MPEKCKTCENRDQCTKEMEGFRGFMTDSNKSSPEKIQKLALLYLLTTRPEFTAFLRKHAVEVEAIYNLITDKQVHVMEAHIVSTATMAMAEALMGFGTEPEEGANA
ncbi:MAG TPA: hypothetical protein ENI05_04430 [Porticoccus sp.]|nr:hypothetical protein [Porticoccus sp.]